MVQVTVQALKAGAGCLPRLLGHQLLPRVVSQVSGALARVVSGLMFCIVLWAVMFGLSQGRGGSCSWIIELLTNL